MGKGKVVFVGRECHSHREVFDLGEMVETWMRGRMT